MSFIDSSIECMSLRITRYKIYKSHSIVKYVHHHWIDREKKKLASEKTKKQIIANITNFIFIATNCAIEQFTALKPTTERTQQR